MRESNSFIGVFDSGVGGMSVLQHLVRELPHETFRYFGDSAHAPYGDRTPEEVRSLTSAVADNMVTQGAKALVIACNTATSAAATLLRETYPQLPIIGVEPALKPAVLAGGTGAILVMATAITLRLDKFQQLSERWATGDRVEAVACVGLAERIEQGNLDAPDVRALIEHHVGSYRGEVDRVVLGCTHYPFVRTQIAEVLGDVRFFDSGRGTARQLHRQLAQRGLLRQEGAGEVSFASSIDTPEELALYQRMFELPL